MPISVTLRTTNFRGDSNAEVQQVHALKDGETVEQLAARLFKSRGSYHEPENDVIEIRLVVEPK